MCNSYRIRRLGCRTTRSSTMACTIRPSRRPSTTANLPPAPWVRYFSRPASAVLCKSSRSRSRCRSVRSRLHATSVVSSNVQADASRFSCFLLSPKQEENSRATRAYGLTKHCIQVINEKDMKKFLITERTQRCCWAFHCPSVARRHPPNIPLCSVVKNFLTHSFLYVLI